MGQLFSCTPGVPGRRTRVPPRHFSAGVTGVIPPHSRITRRRIISISMVELSLIGGAMRSRSLTIGNG
jgi:hypothetical protein